MRLGVRGALLHSRIPASANSVMSAGARAGEERAHRDGVNRARHPGRPCADAREQKRAEELL